MSSNYSNRTFLTLDGIDQIPKQIFDILLQEEDLFKLLKYTDFGVLTNDSFLNLTLKEKKDMVYTRPQDENAHIFFAPYADNAEDKVKSEIRIYIEDIIPEEDNLGVVLIGVDIICHNDLVLIDGSNRPLKLMNLLVRTLNGYTGTSSVSQLQLPKGGRNPLVYFNKRFQGYSLTFKGRISNGRRDCNA